MGPVIQVFCNPWRQFGRNRGSREWREFDLPKLEFTPERKHRRDHAVNERKILARLLRPHSVNDIHSLVLRVIYRAVAFA